MALTTSVLGSSGLSVTAVGFGGYRIDHQVEEHREALIKALAAGINLIDTSANYTDGNSETLIGQVLAALFASGHLERERVVVVSKAGYIQGSNLAESKRRAEAGTPWPELVAVQDGLEHCLHPEFLADQLDRSLERLQLTRLDALLLHNPEYYLHVAEKDGLALGQARAEYLRRIGQAFSYLEGQVAAGRLGCYGVSSNTFVKPSDHAQFTSLYALWHLAAQAHGPEHHFRLVQFPLNLLEPSAAVELNQPGGKSLLQLAAELDLGVLTNRPLNAIFGDRLVRLADGDEGEAGEPDPEALAQALDALQASEDNLRIGVLPGLGWEKGREQRVSEFLSAASILRDHQDEFQDIMHLREVEREYFVPRIGAALRHVFESMPDAPQGRALVESHLELVRGAFWLLGAPYRLQASLEAAALKAGVGSADSEWAQAGRLSQLALRAVRSTAGVGAVLVGMRRPEYVDDVLQELARPVEVKDRAEAWESVARQWAGSE